MTVTPIRRPRVLVRADGADQAPLRARMLGALAGRYETVLLDGLGPAPDVAVMAQRDWERSAERLPACAVIVVRSAREKPAAPGVDASVAPDFEPFELAERVAKQLELARLRALAGVKEDLLLRQHEAEQRLILDTVRAMIWYKDGDNRVLRCNRAAAAWLGRAVAQVEGRRIEELFPAARARAYREHDRAVMASGRPRLGELEELRRPGGSKRWVQRDTFPYRDAGGAIRGVVIIAHDVTALKRAEALAAAKERAEREFVANVSHEFGTPVAAIKGFAQTLRAGAWRRKGERDRFLGIIESNADRLDALVRDLVTLSVLEGAAEGPRPAPVELQPVAEECARRFRPRARRKRLSLELAVPAGLRVRMDAGHLASALGHLLDNAVKFTPPRGRISVGAGARGGQARLWVSDTGAGIPREEQPRVFDSFFRVEKGASPGRGLGLKLVKKLVDAYGGRVSVRSRPSAGSTFSLELPA